MPTRPKKKRKEKGKPTYENTVFPICFADESRKAGTCELVGGILSDFSINQKVDSWWRILVEAETDADAETRGRGRGRGRDNHITNHTI